MTQTLIISDLHLGGRFFHGVLTRPAPLDRLLDALDGIDRLVLLGDTVELAERRPLRSLEIAEPVLRAIGRRLGPGREVVLVPGNHDYTLVRSWVRAQGGELTLDALVPHTSSPALARVTAWLAPAQVTVRYPGVWLSDRVFATHGHYLDHHLRPVSSYGLAQLGLRQPPGDRAAPADYELARRRERSRRAAASAGTLSRLIGLGRFTLARQVKAHLLRPRFSPLTSRLLNALMLHAGMPALAYATERLGVDADWVIFGHLHRLGPLSDDDPALWQAVGGARLLNTGSWLWEPLVIERVHAPHPYWPGGAVMLDGIGPPRAIGLLDELTPDELAPG